MRELNRFFGNLAPCMGGLVLMTLAVFGVGCAAEKYSKAADEEIYGVLDNRRAEILNDTNRFRINTLYSSRTPEDINRTEILLDRYAGGERVLKLTSALELAEKANRTYQFNREKLYLAAMAYTSRRHDFAWRFTSANVDLGIERKTTGGLRGDSDADLKLEKLLEAGTKVSATLANDLVLYFDGGKPKVPSLTLSLTQPLLRGAGAEMAAEVLTQAERDLVYEIRDFSYYQKQFAVGVVNDYLDLLRQGESMRISYINYTTSTNISWEVENRVLAGLQSEYEFKQAKQSEYNAKLGYIGATNAYQNGLDDFKQKLSLPLGTRIRLDYSILNNMNMYNEDALVPVPLTDLLGYRLAITNRLDFHNHVDRFEDSKRKVRVARNDLLPSLSLVADATLKDQFYSSFQPDEFSGNAGLKLNLPLDQFKERNAYRTSLINFERQLRTLATQLDELRDGVRADVRSLSQQRQTHRTQLEAVKNAEDNLKATRERLRLGFPGVRTRDILLAQEQLQSARQSVLRSTVDFHKTRLKLLKDVGILDVSQAEFWFKETAVPGMRAGGAAAADEALPDVVPPEQILGQQP